MHDEAVFIDTNVLLESVLRDRKHALKAQQYIGTHEVVISPLSAHLFVYFGKKDGLELDILLTMLLKHRFTDFGTGEVIWAVKNLRGDDFEDALQVACALSCGAKTFVTFDNKLAQNYREFISVDVL